MNNKLYRIILTSLLGISALISALFFVDVVSEGLLIFLCYVLFAIAAVAAIVFPIIIMIQNPKGAKNALIGVIVMALVFGIGYALSTGKEFYTVNGILLANTTESRWSEAGLIAFYIMGGCSIITVIYAEVSKMFK